MKQMLKSAAIVAINKISHLIHLEHHYTCSKSTSWHTHEITLSNNGQQDYKLVLNSQTKNSGRSDDRAWNRMKGNERWQTCEEFSTMPHTAVAKWPTRSQNPLSSPCFAYALIPVIASARACHQANRRTRFISTNHIYWQKFDKGTFCYH